jgi:flagellar FliL protein
MAKKKQTPEGEPEGSGGKSGGKMMPAVMISLALVAAGYFVGGRGSSSPPAVEAAAEEEAEPEVDHILDLDPINVNLADGHYLRVAISIGMAAGEESSSGGHGGGTEEEGPSTAPAADFVLSTFSGKSIEELSTLDGRISAREHLEEDLREYYGEEVVTVFFTEFVMQ